MAQDRPNATNILETVRDFLEQLLPTLDGDARFKTRVSVHLLDIVARELGRAEEFERRECAALEALLHHQGELADLNRELSEQIRSGALDEQHERVFAHVLASIEDKLRIVKPRQLVSKLDSKSDPHPG